MATELTTSTNPICCPEFAPDQWENKTLQWEDKKFIKDRVITFFNMPLNFGQVMRRLDKKVSEAGALMQDGLCLSEHTSKWNMNVYLAIDKEITSAVNTTLSGKFYSKVYEGPYKEMGKWFNDFAAVIKNRGVKSKIRFAWYTTCPKCAKKYGKNYVVLISQDQ